MKRDKKCKKEDGSILYLMDQQNESIFLGEFEHTLDTQRRVSIPSAWRGEGAERFVLIPSRGHFLQLLPFVAFREMVADKVRTLSLENNRTALDLAKLGSRSQECVCDKQGRIQISSKLAEHAGLSDKAVLVGAIGYAQIWSPEEWARSQGGEDDCYEVLGQLAGGGNGK